MEETVDSRCSSSAAFDTPDPRILSSGSSGPVVMYFCTWCLWGHFQKTCRCLFPLCNQSHFCFNLGLCSLEDQTSKSLQKPQQLQNLIIISSFHQFLNILLKYVDKYKSYFIARHAGCHITSTKKDCFTMLDGQTEFAKSQNN